VSEQVLQILWYIVFLAIIAGYVVLDGFDLGVGALHILARNDQERRVFLNAIGPVWDGNEVWLIVLGGALFAGFPFAYATVMSAFYTVVMIFIAALIFRAVAIEVRSKAHHAIWRSIWDWSFCLASIVIALGLGLLLGNFIHGIALDENFLFTGDFGALFHPYAILVAFLVLALCTMHGAIYLLMKTEGEIHERLRRWIVPTIAIFIILYIAATVATLVFQHHMRERFEAYPWLLVVPAVSLLAIANIPWEVHRHRDGWAFISSTVAIILLLALYAIGTYPILVRSLTDPENNSLTIANSYASAKTLGILLIIVCIGIPLALSYIISVYYIFRGKVKLDPHSY
jgi:cytochrome bd ubiquinol oxidase subunit II